MLKDLKIATKLNILLVLISVIIVVLSGFFLSILLRHNAEEVVAEKALLLIETMASVRNYTSTEVNPKLAERLKTDPQFLPQTVPAYAARTVFDDFRNQGDYRDFFYKEATLNPTNVKNDKADDFETQVIKKFRENPNLEQDSGFRSLDGRDIFYIARPLAVKKESCLRCHSTPQAAPASQIATYGSDNGFGWKLNEIVGVKMISVPANRILENAQKLQNSVTSILVVCLLIAIILINAFMKITVTKPLTKMAQLAQRISTGDLSQEFKHPFNDEMGLLAASLNRMKVSLEIAMDMLTSDSE